MAATKRKRSSVAVNGDSMPSIKRRSSTRRSTADAIVNPEVNGDVLDGPNATRASPSKEVNCSILPSSIKQENGTRDESPLSDAPDVLEPPKKRKGRGKAHPSDEQMKHIEEVIDGVVHDAAKKMPGGKEAKKTKGRKKIEEETADTVMADIPTAPVAAAPKVKKEKNGEIDDPEADGDEEADEEEVKEALSRPPPVNSDYLPLPWKGRLGYACLNTYLRNSNPPVFSSRTCRIQSILEHRHPLADPSQPEHPTKNRPDRSQPADVARGQRYVEALCLANVKDIEKMVRWNDKYNIKFFRLSSEMFPFASHPEYGYKLAPFASEALAQAGRVVAELGHRVTTHPGQFTQLGSPRESVIDNAVRDLEYHDELLSLLKLPEQLDKDAVMILHMGGMFEGKTETIQRFKENYAKLSQSIKNRLVLENDDMGWSVHDILPVCEELNIPMVLDFHHHNIVFDSTQIREGTADIVDLYPRILATWEKKGITPKMHYSEPTPPAITPRQRRKHNPRPATLPPCPPTMDLMIEAKDKEQAVFELMRTFKLPGFDKINDVIPYTRNDDNKAADAANKKTARKGKKSAVEAEEPAFELVPEEEVGMGGSEGRVYWPPGMEEWLRPKKREVKKKEPAEQNKELAKKQAATLYAERVAKEQKEKATSNGSVIDEGEESDELATPATKKAKAAMKKKAQVDAAKAVAAASAPQKPKAAARKTRTKKEAPIPSPPSEKSEDLVLHDDEEEQVVTTAPLQRPIAGSREASGRRAKVGMSYNEDDGMEEV